MKFKEGSVLIEFVIYIPICLLIIISIFYIAIDKVNIVKKRSEMIQKLNEDVDSKSFNVFSKNTEISESFSLSSVYGLIEDEISVNMFSGVKRARNILSNIKLLKDILVDIGFDERFMKEINLSGSFR